MALKNILISETPDTRNALAPGRSGPTSGRSTQPPAPSQTAQPRWMSAPVVAEGTQEQPRWMSAPVVQGGKPGTGMDTGEPVREQPPWSTTWRKSQGPTGLEDQNGADSDRRSPGALDRANAVAAGFNRGVTGILGLPVDFASNVLDLAKAGVGYGYHELTGKPIPDALQLIPRDQVPGSGEWIANKLDQGTEALGVGPVTQLPRPDDQASRLLYAAGAGSTAAIAPGSAGARLPAALSGIAGSEAGQVTAEAGGDRNAQLLANVVGSVAPGGIRYGGAELVRRSLRGDEAGRARTEQNLQTFNTVGGNPSAGQATESRLLRSTESLLSRTPGAAGRMTSFANQQAQDIGAGIERQAARLAPRSSAEQAGRAIDRGISDAGGFLDRFRGRSRQLYSEVDRHIPAQQPVAITNTQRALNDLAAPVPGAQETSRHLINQRVGAIAEGIGADARNGQMPYEAVARLRTLVGEQLVGAPLLGDVPIGQWRRLYGALSADLRIASQQAGPQAARAFNRADTYYRSGANRMEVLEGVLNRNGGPESIFRAATSGTKEGASTLHAVMQSLPVDAQRMVTATVLRRLGRATPGHQDDLGARFSTETFLTNWSSLSDSAKNVLFNRQHFGPTFREDMNQVARAAANLRAGSQVFRNPSGTGQAVAQTTAASSFVLSVIGGRYDIAGGVAGGAALSNLTARLLTQQRFVRWLAHTTRAPISALPALVNQLEQSKEPDERELADALKQAQQSQYAASEYEDANP